MAKAVAIDFGASSARYGIGEWNGDRIEFRVIRQIAHNAIEQGDRIEWDIEALVAFAREAVEFAQREGAATVGIDTWGVDHGFLDAEGNLLAAPVCYRDPSHEAAFQKLAEHRDWLYSLTGCQHQPFNTIYQLWARREQNPELPRQAASWLLLPDLLAQQLGAEPHVDLTHASTTQLLGLDGQWCPETFELIGWPVPTLSPQLPGTLSREVAPGVRIARVGGHDTASAVAGFGPLEPGTAFANIGTWSLIGVVIPEPLADEKAAAANLTNERTVDGQVRLLKNVPGFYVVNRVFEELRPASSVVEWLSGAELTTDSIDLQHPDLFNPDSMSQTCAQLAPRAPESASEWAGLLLNSLAVAISNALAELGEVTGVPVTALTVGGGGSQSAALCQAIEKLSGAKVVRGAAEATLLGNLAVQFLAQGVFQDRDVMQKAIVASV